MNLTHGLTLKYCRLPSTSLLEAEGEDSAQVAQTFVPCIHVISKSKFELASSEPGVETVTASRTDLIDFLAEPLGHDRHAGEFLLLALLAKTYGKIVLARRDLVIIN